MDAPSRSRARGQAGRAGDSSRYDRLARAYARKQFGIGSRDGGASGPRRSANGVTVRLQSPRRIPAGKRIAICPATYSDATCETCGACARVRDAGLVSLPMALGGRSGSNRFSRRRRRRASGYFRNIDRWQRFSPTRQQQPDAFTLQICGSGEWRRWASPVPLGDDGNNTDHNTPSGCVPGGLCVFGRTLLPRIAGNNVVSRHCSAPCLAAGLRTSSV